MGTIKAKMLQAKIRIGEYIAMAEKTNMDESETARLLCDEIVNVLDEETASLKWYFLDRCEKHLREMEEREKELNPGLPYT